jgi:DNA transformation protein
MSGQRPSDVAEHLGDVFRLFGPIEVRRMFGGYGVYREGLMFALVADDTLYLKSDAVNIDEFRRHDLAPFAYERKGKLTPTSYYAAPASVMEDGADAARWGRLALDAALRAAAARRKPARKPARKSVPKSAR